MSQKQHSRLVVKLFVVTVAMFGFGYALVPLYDVFCDITGLNGKTNTAPADPTAMVVDKNRTVNIEFIASVDSRGAWRFKPKTTKMSVHPGQVYEIYYVAENRHGSPVDGQAVPSVSPGPAAKYLQKIECFCFNRQAFETGEKKDMLVKFVVDPAMPKEISTITLSYTLYTALPE